MNWQLLLKKLKAHGYKGDEGSLDAVKSYIEDHFDGAVVNGEPIDVAALHAKAFPPKSRLDLTTDTKDAEIESLRAQLATKRVEDEVLGKGRSETTSTNKAIDINVGKDRLADDPKGGFKSFGHFLQAVITTGGAGDRAFSPKSGSTLERWQKAFNGATQETLDAQIKDGLIQKATLSTYSNEGTGADGGFAVPPDFMAGIQKRTDAEPTLYSMCQQATLSGNQLTATIDDTNPWDSSGGVQPYWLDEAETITQSKVALKQRNFRLKKIGVLVPITDELSQDASFLGSYIGRLAGEKVDYAIDNAILNGNGVTRPTGVVGHNGTISVTKETNQTAATIKANNVQKMWMRWLPRSRRTGVWLINADAQVQLQRMFVQGTKDSNTAIAAGSLVYLPANGLAGQPNDTLFGRPIIYHQACQTLGTVGDIIGFDPQSYIVCNKGTGLEYATSMHLWFDQAVNALRFIRRIEGQPWWMTTVSAANGSTTYASFVTLATRS